MREKKMHKSHVDPSKIEPTKAAVKVLVADGNPKITQVLSSYVKLFGHATDEAHDGREAVRQLQSSRYNIVITDPELFSIDGMELCKFIKSQRPLSHTSSESVRREGAMD
jgi:CheY-like chemotaxis protein